MALSMMLVGCSGGSGSSTSSSSTDTATVSGGSQQQAASESDSTSTAPMKLVTPGTLTIGSDCDYPPFISMNGTQPQGFE
jgi:hypothetical protein